ncbi:hypothetical protein EW145_g2033 [Phellinidium pouzarii]|uniref:Peptidase A1 domain-containing protein n=1 Tax=Phellinidium pouzarii TaxID=167371 RepID=A0A4S4LCC0_9AGAM|nr:hypothetical protein EW145_g2033 [Phellinidium pouzarii]
MITRLNKGLLLLQILLSALGVGSVAANNFYERSDVTPLGTVNIPLTVNSDRRYVVSVNMSSSLNTQRFKFALAANTGYNASASSSKQAWPGSKSIAVGTTSLVGPLIKENCGLHEVNGTAWQYPNQTRELGSVSPSVKLFLICGFPFCHQVIVANTSSSLFSNVTSGLVGLGTNANGAAGDFLDTIFGQWLADHPTHDNFTFGMALQPPIFTSDDDTGNGGILHWVVPDSNAYVGNVSWNTADVSSAIVGSPTSSNGVSDTVANTSPELPESDWTIEMDGWTVTTSETIVSNSSKAQTVVEPFIPDIMFPQGQADLFYTAIPSAIKLSSLIDGAQAWSIPCDTMLSVAFTFSGQAFLVDESQLVVTQSDGTCMGTIKAWPDPTVSNFLLGSNFISAFYLIFVIGRSGSGISNSIGVATRASASSKTHVGAIVGGSVGGVVFVVVIVISAYALGRRSRKKRSNSLPESLHPNDEKGRLCTKHDVETDDEGAQYVSMPIILLAPKNSRSQIPSPSSARSASSTHALFPEVQYLNSPALNIPSTPSTSTDFLPMSTSPYRGHNEGGSTVMSHISYNSSALGANTRASRAAASNQDFNIEPFVPPTSFGVHGQSSTLKTNSSPDLLSSQGGRPLGTFNFQHNNVSIPSTIATVATSVPLVLQPPLKMSASARGDKPDLTSLQALRDGIDTPAPPYTRGTELTSLNPVSPTLVDYSPSTIPPGKVERG